MRTDIRSRMILVVGLPTAAILITAFVLSLVYFHRQTYQDAREEIRLQAGTYATRFNDSLDHAVVLTRTTATTMECIEALSFDHIQELLKTNVTNNGWVFGCALAISPDFRTHNGDLFSPYAFRREGEVVTMNIGRETYDWVNDPNYQWFSTPARTLAPVWTKPYFDDGAGNVLMTTYAHPIFRNEQFFGVATTDINLTQLDTETQKLLGLPGEFIIIDADGDYIYTHNESLILSGSFLEEVNQSNNPHLITAVHKALEGETGTTLAKWANNNEVLIAYAPIQSTGWSYITRVPESQVMDLVHQRMILPTLGFLTALALVIWSILSASKKLARPIVNLRGKVLQVADGNLDVKADTTGAKDEITDLAHSFNRMTDELRNQITRIANEQSRRREADEANQAKSQFLSHMSHELRTPLNGVLGYAQILQRDAAITGSQRNNLDGIINCGDHLLSLINDVLDLSKIEAKREEMNLAALDLERLLHSVRDIVAERAKSKGLEFSLEVSPEVPRIIISDKGKIRQILINLIGNAVKFTKTGSINLTTRESDSGTLEFSVTDTGVGISEESLKTIFDPFKQAEGGKAAGGTGLGLAISQNLARLLGGSLTVTSTLGKGSCFTFTLPFQESDDNVMLPPDVAEANLDAATRLTPGQNITLLVADDGDANRDIMQQMLESAGFHVLMATDGDEALQLLEAQTSLPPLALLDVRMPRMNGITVMQHIRQNARWQGMKVIAVTASVFPDFRAKALAAGFDDFIGKPFRIDELLTCLKTHLSLEFETETPPPPAESSAANTDVTNTIDPALLSQLQQALKIRSLTQINAIARELQTNPRTNALGEKIISLASKFDFQSLQTTIHSLTAHTENSEPS